MPQRRSTIRTTATASGAVWLVVVVGVVLELTHGIDELSWIRMGGLVGAGAASTVMIALLLGRRAGKIADIERVARAIVAADIGKPRDPRVAIQHAPAEETGEFAPVYEALDELALRVEKQHKSVAKHASNLGAIIDAMDEPLIATDNQERVLLCNRSAEALLGVSRTLSEPAAGMIGRPISEVFTQAELLEMHAAARQGQTSRLRVRVMTAIGQRVLQVSALPVPAAWGAGVFGAVMILRDVTELDQAVQVKADFVANASHELRTPVAAIRMAAETLKDAVRDDPAMAEKVAAMVLSHALRLEDLLRDLLDLSRLESPDVPLVISEIDLDALGASLSQQFEGLLHGRRLQLRFEFDDDTRGLKTDARLLTLILRNLVENSCKFAFEGSTIRIVGTMIEEEVGSEKGSRPLRGVARFEVIDKGMGIPLAHQERVFERFYQVDSARSGPTTKRGTGLGLAIVKHAARALKGTVGLDSTWGEGTTAWVEVPVAFAAGPDPAASAPSAT